MKGARNYKCHSVECMRVALIDWLPLTRATGTPLCVQIACDLLSIIRYSYETVDPIVRRGVHQSLSDFQANQKRMVRSSQISWMEALRFGCTLGHDIFVAL